jgi:serine/threonine protein kinase
MKVMKPEMAAKEANRLRFVREAQAAALVEHDHIVPILTVGEENNVPFIVMPFLKGEALDARLKKSRLETSDIIRIARQTAAGLAVAHEHERPLQGRRNVFGGVTQACARFARSGLGSQNGPYRPEARPPIL